MNRQKILIAVLIVVQLSCTTENTSTPSVAGELMEGFLNTEVDTPAQSETEGRLEELINTLSNDVTTAELKVILDSTQADLQRKTLQSTKQREATSE